MSFIAKNPLIMPEVEDTHSVPDETRGLIAGKDGWYDINSSKEKKKIVTEDNLLEAVNELYELLMPTRAFVNILGGADNWVAEDVTNSAGEVVGSRYGQVVNVNNAIVTPNSKVDLQLTSEQMVIFYEKDLAFVAEQEDGVVTIYCIGNIPEHNYRLQATVTEVGINA